MAIRSYQDKSLPPEAVLRIVQAGRLTGSAMNSQPWHFIVIEEWDTLRQLDALARIRPYIAQTPLAIVVLIERSKFAPSDGSRAIQSMILAGWAEGTGSKWVGFLGFDEVKTLLHVPDEMDVLAILPFGYPAEALEKGMKKRKPLAAVASRGRYSEPFQ